MVFVTDPVNDHLQKERDIYEAGREEAHSLGDGGSKAAGGTVRADGKQKRELGIDKNGIFGL